jgi:hypothetical protein
MKTLENKQRGSRRTFAERDEVLGWRCCDRRRRREMSVWELNIYVFVWGVHVELRLVRAVVIGLCGKNRESELFLSDVR